MGTEIQLFLTKKKKEEKQILACSDGQRCGKTEKEYKIVEQ